MTMDTDLLSELPTLRRAGVRAVLVTVVETQGSTPRKAGARMLVFADGTQRGTIGGGAVEHAVKQAAPRVLRTGEPKLLHYKLTVDLAMCCGGHMSLFLEPVMGEPTLIVFGCGHVGAALIQAAAPLGFSIVAVDDLEENAHPKRLPQAAQIINTYAPSELESVLPFGADTYVVIATRQHALDQTLIELCLRHPARFVGAIGSQRKAHLQRERLAAKGFSPSDIARLHCPVGLDLGAQTPAEIAVAICAQLVRAKRQAEDRSDGDQPPQRPTPPSGPLP